MTGHREPPAEWIPLIAAIVQIDDVQIAFGSALTNQIELETGRRVLWDSFPNKMVGPDSAVEFLLSGFRVIATARGRLTTVLDDKADDALGEIAARAVNIAHRVAGLAVAYLVTDGIYKAHGRHGTLHSPHEPIPGDLVYAQAVSFDLCTGIASYSDGAKAAFVHLERTNKRLTAEAVARLQTVFWGKHEPVLAYTNPSQKYAPAPGRKEAAFRRWLSDLIDAAGSEKALKRAEVRAIARKEYGLSWRDAASIRQAVLRTKSPEIQDLYTIGGAPKKSD